MNVGTGMIGSHRVNLSVLLGAVFSWGIMWPVIGKHKGYWFPADLPGYSMQGLSGYKVTFSSQILNLTYTLTNPISNRKN